MPSGTDAAARRIRWGQTPFAIGFPIVELQGRDLPEALEGAVRSVMAGASVAATYRATPAPRSAR